MSTILYDNALLDKLNRWVKNSSDVRITGPNETRRLFQYTLDQNNDQSIKLPLIALSRDPVIQIKETTKQALTYMGFKRDANSNGALHLNAVPIRLTYQLDIYTRYYEEAEEYVRNFVFNIINHPKLTINVPYNGYNEIKNANLTLDSNINDNSDISERLIQGQFTRKTLTIIIEDAYLWDVKIKDTVTICEDSQVLTD
jgi:hypothetical protein